MFGSIAYLATGDGARLAYRFQPARGTPCGIALLSHGLAEHCARYADFAAILADAGFETYAHDHRGHGHTKAPGAPLGRFAHANGVNRVVEDLRAMRELAVSNHPGLPVLLFGHSMGGLIALSAATRFPDLFQALAVWNSNFDLGLPGHVGRLVLKIERALKGSDVPSEIMNRATFESWGKAIDGHKTLFDWLSRDEQEVAAYIADPLCGFPASISLWLDVMQLSLETATPQNLSRLARDMPVHLAGGGQDPATNKARATRNLAARLRKAGLHHVNLTIHDDMRHETLHERGAQQAAQAFALWAREAMKRA
ncbi:alpha/beta fold hydrolase [Allorhizobium undicola]|uniref:alpha/beta fold hydrolase n=1 Tax=Allorhizobium undicola TaxID=78527 RepID=UPI0004839631|nr:alpha/beta hydrolase [Allorhizobium undicola]